MAGVFIGLFLKIKIVFLFTHFVIWETKVAK